jgi:hypothetical protein
MQIQPKLNEILLALQIRSDMTAPHTFKESLESNDYLLVVGIRFLVCQMLRRTFVYGPSKVARPNRRWVPAQLQLGEESKRRPTPQSPLLNCTLKLEAPQQIQSEAISLTFILRHCMTQYGS